MKKIILLLFVIANISLGQITSQSPRFYYMIGANAIKLRDDILEWRIGGGAFRWNSNQLQFSNDLTNWYAIPQSLPTGGGWTLGLNKIYQTTAGDPIHIRNSAGDTTGTQLLNVYGNIGLLGAKRLIGTYTNHDFGIVSNGSERVIITSNGDVGINLSIPPTQRLDMVGAINTRAPSSAAGAYNLAIFSHSPYGDFNNLSNRELRVMTQNNEGNYNQYVIYNGRVAGSLSSPTYIQGIYGRFTAIEFEGGNINFLVNPGDAGNGTELEIIPTRALTIYYNGNIGFGVANPQARVHISHTNGYQQLILATPYTPTSTSDPNGVVGTISWDDNYIYVKTSGGWKRAQLSNF